MKSSHLVSFLLVISDRLQPVARPKFSVTDDALWRSLLSGIAGQQGF